jgi:cytochrome bd-type quinol oxidase subunit 2
MDIKSVIFLIGVLGSLFAVYVINRVKEKSGELSLRAREKSVIWLLCFMMPMISGAIFYYGLKNKFKAKQANRISFIAFFIVLVLYIILMNFNNR